MDISGRDGGRVRVLVGGGMGRWFLLGEGRLGEIGKEGRGGY